jgi:hypothetical protein
MQHIVLRAIKHFITQSTVVGRGRVPTAVVAVLPWLYSDPPIEGLHPEYVRPNKENTRYM